MYVKQKDLRRKRNPKDKTKSTSISVKYSQLVAADALASKKKIKRSAVFGDAIDLLLNLVDKNGDVLDHYEFDRFLSDSLKLSILIDKDRLLTTFWRVFKTGEYVPLELGEKLDLLYDFMRSFLISTGLYGDLRAGARESVEALISFMLEQTELHSYAFMSNFIVGTLAPEGEPQEVDPFEDFMPTMRRMQRCVSILSLNSPAVTFFVCFCIKEQIVPKASEIEIEILRQKDELAKELDKEESEKLFLDICKVIYRDSD